MGSKSCKQPSSIEQKKVGCVDAQRLTALGVAPQSRRLSCFCWYHVPRYFAVKIEMFMAQALLQYCSLQTCQIEP